MARRKSYDRDSAVTAAMHTFWARGYSNTGVRQIERETGINRFALNTEFNGKTGLFLEALNAYLAMSRETMLKDLSAGGLDGIRAFLKGLVKGGASDPRRYGCLMVNTVIENADLGLEEVRAIATAHFDALQASFEDALRMAKQNSELPLEFDIPAAARTLLTFSMGVEVFVRMQEDLGAAQQQVDFLLSLIDRWTETT
ncbi:TetR/AcrR family transcriptional regulator [Marimonas arenosa]|uniref:TetR/AcrR family transcriptional regulator n=1 Tax=Marimonas arenosa TaxID=1795305 RepID=A0AAE3WCT9_9RHOB|nr:helix-turn-helix domain-containing protein [Marimonas arenosa]MDQ2090596.1 TetR/AcrR family transcriptional regulator [Marimonas arenosa]